MLPRLLLALVSLLLQAVIVLCHVDVGAEAFGRCKFYDVFAEEEWAHLEYYEGFLQKTVLPAEHKRFCYMMYMRLASERFCLLNGILQDDGRLLAPPAEHNGRERGRYLELVAALISQSLPEIEAKQGLEVAKLAFKQVHQIVNAVAPGLPMKLRSALAGGMGNSSASGATAVFSESELRLRTVLEILHAANWVLTPAFPGQDAKSCADRSFYVYPERERGATSKASGNYTFAYQEVQSPFTNPRLKKVMSFSFQVKTKSIV